MRASGEYIGAMLPHALLCDIGEPGGEHGEELVLRDKLHRGDDARELERDDRGETRRECFVSSLSSTALIS